MWACKVLLSLFLDLQGQKVKTISKILSRSYNRWNLTIAMLPQMTQNQRKLINEHCESVWWEYEWFCRSCSVLPHLTWRYFDRFLLQGVDRNQHQACFFYLALGLICEGYWQVNSWRTIFHIANPTLGYKINIKVIKCTNLTLKTTLSLMNSNPQSIVYIVCLYKEW